MSGSSTLRVLLALACVGWIVTGVAAAASKPRADLSIPRGSVAGAADRISGGFTVHDVGRKARATSASLGVRVAGRRRILKRYAVPALKAATSHKVKVDLAAPQDLPVGTFAIDACADAKRDIRERTETNNCRKVGSLIVAEELIPTPTPTPSPTSTPAATPSPTPPSTFPSDPLDPATDGYGMATISFASGSYSIRLGPKYDHTHHTPIALLVGLHGCGDTAINYLSWAVTPTALRSSQNYIAASVGGRDGACWTTSTDSALLLNVIADIKTHFNIDPRRVVLMGYDSGGAVAYHTAFYNADLFAGMLALPTQPFASSMGPDSQVASIAAATWKFNIVHVVHTDDEVYPVATVKSQVAALHDAGFPTTEVDLAGPHSSGADDAELLVAHMDDPWLAPAP